jgi:hypothetical protein
MSEEVIADRPQLLQRSRTGATSTSQAETDRGNSLNFTHSIIEHCANFVVQILVWSTENVYLHIHVSLFYSKAAIYSFLNIAFVA